MITADHPRELVRFIGRSATGAWLPIAQERIDAFADVTEDHQWIHVDVERAASGPFATTVAHGLLTLSLIPRLIDGLVVVGSTAAVINYGIDGVRFLTPVPRGARIRARTALTAADETATGVRVRLAHTIDLDGSERPALVAETIHVFVPTT